jgi:hypothetical protein
VTVTDQQAAALRAFLSAQSEQDAQDAGQMFRQLADSDTAEGTGELIYAAFVVAARRKLAPRWTLADVVRYVAHLRARSADNADELDPAAAENQLRAALGEQIAPHRSEEDRGTAQVLLLLLLELTHDLCRTPSELDELLGQARTFAEQLA